MDIYDALTKIVNDSELVYLTYQTTITDAVIDIDIPTYIIDLGGSHYDSIAWAPGAHDERIADFLKSLKSGENALRNADWGALAEKLSALRTDIHGWEPVEEAIGAWLDDFDDIDLSAEAMRGFMGAAEECYRSLFDANVCSDLYYNDDVTGDVAASIYNQIRKDFADNEIREYISDEYGIEIDTDESGNPIANDDDDDD